MALNPLDFLEMPNEMLHPDLRKPVEFLFRFIGERWSVTGETPPQDEAHTGVWPLDYDRYPCMADRLDAIRENILLLAPHFVNLDLTANQPTGWAAVPLFYSAAAIAADQELRPVLVTPSRGTTYGVYRPPGGPYELYIDFVKAAAKCLSRFRYVCAAPWTRVPSKAKLDVQGSRAASGETAGAGVASEYFDVNGETVAGATYDTGSHSWIRMAELDSLLGGQGAKTVVPDGTYQPRPWGISGHGIDMTVSASASCVATVGPADGGWWTTPYEYFGRAESVGFSISGIPEKVVVANPFGYFAECLLVYGPAPEYDHGNIIPSHRKQTTIVQDGDLEDLVERIEFSGQFVETFKHSYDGSVETERKVAYSNDGTRSRVVFDETASPGSSFLSLGRNVKNVDREKYYDTFGEFPIGTSGDAADHPVGIEFPAKDVGPVLGHDYVVAFVGYDPKTLRLIVQPDLCPQNLLDEARAIYGSIGIPKYFNPNNAYYDGLGEHVSVTVSADCHLVPILDFGTAFKLTEDEGEEDWTGCGLHGSEENQ